MGKFFASEGYVTTFDFLSKLLCLTVPRNFVGRAFSVSLLSGAEKVWIREGGVSRVSVEIFFLTVPKNFVGEPFCAVFQKISVVKKWMREGGVSRFSVENC